MKLVGRTWQLSQQVAPGTPVVIELPEGGDFTVAVATVATGSALVETTTAPTADLRGAGTPIWRPWAQGSGGTVGASTTAAEGFNTPRTAIRITATTVACRLEVVQRADPA